jgi:hypothetical protein
MPYKKLKSMLARLNRGQKQVSYGNLREQFQKSCGSSDRYGSYEQ